MLYIDITGKIKNKRVIEKYVYNTLMHFFRKEPKRDIDINIHFVKQCDGNHSGLCDGDHDEINIDIAKGSVWDGKYLTYSYDDMLIALAHELVHAKQYLKKELTPYHGSWRGKSINTKYLSYEDFPWEKEAYSWEKTLFEMYWRGREND